MCARALGSWETVAGPGPTDLAVCEAGGGDIVAEIVNGNVAHRDLIAAAPDLLAALRALYETTDYAATNAYLDDTRENKQARAAIAKAEGR